MYAARGQQVPDPVGEHPGLAGARTGHDEQRTTLVHDRGSLLPVEPGQQRRRVSRTRRGGHPVQMGCHHGNPRDRRTGCRPYRLTTPTLTTPTPATPTLGTPTPATPTLGTPTPTTAVAQRAKRRATAVRAARPRWPVAPRRPHAAAAAPAAASARRRPGRRRRPRRTGSARRGPSARPRSSSCRRWPTGR